MDKLLDIGISSGPLSLGNLNSLECALAGHSFGSLEHVVSSTMNVILLALSQTLAVCLQMLPVTEVEICLDSSTLIDHARQLIYIHASQFCSAAVTLELTFEHWMSMCGLWRTILTKKMHKFLPGTPLWSSWFPALRNKDSWCGEFVPMLEGLVERLWIGMSENLDWFQLKMWNFGGQVFYFDECRWRL